MVQGSKTINELRIGDKASLQRTVSSFDVYTLAEISGDINPLHVNKEFASKSLFRERVAHGFLTSALISAVIGTQLPGPGTIYVSQNLVFVAPVKIGDTIEAEVEVVNIFFEKNRVELNITCRNQDSQVVLSGGALVRPPREPITWDLT
jgi:3-hydroxybutyryl-CoA dehydratase